MVAELNESKILLDKPEFKNHDASSPVQRVIREGNRLPFVAEKFSLEAFKKREVVMEDGSGQKFSFGAHYNGHGKGLVKGGNLCFRMKTIEGKEMVELDFKINHVFRKSVQKALTSNPSKKTHFDMGGFLSQEVEFLEVKNLGSISIGSNPENIGLYTRVVVQIPLETTLPQLQKLLSYLNLAEVLEPSSSDDLERLKIGQLFRFFFPKEATLFERTPEFYNLTIPKLKARIIRLAPAMKDIFEEYLAKMERYKTLKGRVRYRVKGIRQKCSSLGALSLLTTLITHSSDQNMIDKTISILKMGVLSTDLRYASGMQLPGVSSYDDLLRGSSDSVFTQLVTSTSYEAGIYKHFSWISKNKITFVLDIDLLETGPYQYHNDKSGTRQFQSDYLNRSNIIHFVKAEQIKPKSSNEVMIKDRIPPSAIRGILVGNDQLRESLIQALRKKGLIQVEQGVETIFHVPVDEFIKPLKILGFPKLLSQVKVVNASLGGTRGAQLIEDIKGNKFVQKTTDRMESAHLVTEYSTSKAYKALGIFVPEVALYHSISSRQIKTGEKIESSSPVLLSTFVNGQEVGKYLNLSYGSVTEAWRQEHAAALKEVQDLAKKGFVADCLLANWDVVGLSFDNTLIDSKEKIVWRVDHGSGMDFRAQGSKKSPREFTPHIQEFQTFRDPKINPNAALLFETITNKEIIEQIDAILPKREALLAVVPDHLKEIMGKRFDYLTVYKKSLQAAHP